MLAIYPEPAQPMRAFAPRHSGIIPPMPTSTPHPRYARRVLLVSQSPRRRRLMEWLGLPVEVTSVDTPEELDSPLAADPSALARHLAAEKACEARGQGLGDDALVLTFDTIVVLDDEILGKPADLDDAWRMLRALSGRTHQVVTAVALLCPDDPGPRTFAVVTDVRMQDLSDERIREWMARGEFMGCAGAYNIEGQIAEVASDQCYQNVAGLPLCDLYRELTGPDAPACLDHEASHPAAPCNAALDRECRALHARS